MVAPPTTNHGLENWGSEHRSSKRPSLSPGSPDLPNHLDRFLDIGFGVYLGNRGVLMSEQDTGHFEPILLAKICCRVVPKLVRVPGRYLLILWALTVASVDAVFDRS